MDYGAVRRRRRMKRSSKKKDSEKTPYKMLIHPIPVKQMQNEQKFVQKIDCSDKSTTAAMKLEVTNTHNSTVKIVSWQISRPNDFEVLFLEDIQMLDIGGKCVFQICLKNVPENVGVSGANFQISFKDTENIVVTQIYQVVFDKRDPLISGPSTEENSSKHIKRFEIPTSEIHGYIHGEKLPPLQSDDLERSVNLLQYFVRSKVKVALDQGAFSEKHPNKRFKKLRLLAEKELNPSNYADKLHLLLDLEELQKDRDILRYSMSSVSFSRQGHLLFLEVKGLAEKRPSVLKGDRIFAAFHGEDLAIDKQQYEGYVHVVGLDQIGVGFSGRLLDVHKDTNKYDVRFTCSRLTSRLSHRAVDLTVSEFVRFPKPCSVLYPGISIKRSDFINDSIKSNLEQMQAITNIVQGKRLAVPYIVFGPPGTGKTVTLVESICQVIRVYEGCHILACAPSNSACDHLTALLLRYMSPDKVFRMHAASRLWRDVPAVIQNVSNYRSNNFYFPPKQDFEQYGVVVCTLYTAGRIASAGFEEDYFTHVFIDEAGQSTEPECMIALSGILSEFGQLVLAGDPKQLGPIVTSSLAKRYGLGISFLERLMNTCKVYKKDENSSLYDVSYITKLLKNYRSHKAILKVPNQCFYENELTYCVKITRTMESICQWSYLPQPGFPVIFEGIVGEDKRDSNSPSFFNGHELSIVKQYVDKIRRLDLPEDSIGIISPYRAQVEKIKSIVSSSRIKVGTVEEFQGQERNVIIVSTVRSNIDDVPFDAKHNLGFLTDPRRFDVTITRAKMLLVIIGNPYILSLDKYWKTMLNYCIDENAYRGVAYVPDDETDDVLLAMNDINIDE